MRFYRVLTEQDARELAALMPGIVSVDTEYSQKEVRKANLLSIQVATDDETAYYFEPEFLPIIGPALNRTRTCFMQNYVVDKYILGKNGCELTNTNIMDLMLLDHLVDERVDHGLGEIVLREFGDDYKKTFWSKYRSFEEADPQEALEYSCKDVVYTLRLGKARLAQLEGKDRLIEQVHKLSWALFDTTIQGINVDVPLMLKTKQEMEQQISGFLPALRSHFNDECTLWELRKWAQNVSKLVKQSAKENPKHRPKFNFGSTQQVSWLLYDQLRLPVIKRTPKKRNKKGLISGGNPSTEYDVLVELLELEPRLKPLVDYNEIKNIYATFVVRLLEKVEDGKVYPEFHVNGTDTGRISHSNPSMGNMPKDGVIRNFFIPRSGYSIVGADYSQLEVIIEANLTEDQQLLKIVLEGASKHDITSQGLSLPRDTGKTLNFALQYGAGVRKVSKLLNISQKEAQDIFDRYWELYSGVKFVKEQTNKELEETQQVTNLFGRTRHFDLPSNKYDLFKQQRQAYNFKIQGVAAEACNRAFWLFHEHCKSMGYGRALWSVHDEIVAEIKTEYAQQAMQDLVSIMVDVSDFLGFKYKLQAKPYGPLQAWAKAG